MKVALAALVLALTPALQAAQAYKLEGEKWATHSTSFAYVVPGRSTAFTQAVKQALADWTSATTFTYKPLNKSANPCNPNLANGIGFTQKICDGSPTGTAFGSSTLAVTLTSYSLPSRKYVRAATVFNAHKSFSVYSGKLRAGSTDFRRVAVHELGHALGLDHETVSGIKSIMTVFVGNIEKPQPDDIAGVKAMYP